MTLHKITAIIRTHHLESVEESLQEIQVSGVSISQVKGYGEYTNFFTRDWMSPHARIEIFVKDEDVEKTVQAIVDGAHTGMAGDGIVAVLPVEKIYRIRTKAEAKENEI